MHAILFLPKSSERRTFSRLSQGSQYPFTGCPMPSHPTKNTTARFKQNLFAEWTHIWLVDASPRHFLAEKWEIAAKMENFHAFFNIDSKDYFNFFSLFSWWTRLQQVSMKKLMNYSYVCHSFNFRSDDWYFDLVWQIFKTRLKQLLPYARPRIIVSWLSSFF